jgi:SAM-dependent methyltransferase
VGDNAAQIEFWNGPSAQKWVARQDELDQSLAQVTEALYAAAAVKAGERVLDVGCGCGTPTLELARRSGAPCAGIDISAPMLAVARSRAGSNLRFVEADASAYAFVTKFDVAFSRFGVMFFADPVAAFKNIHGALHPGGRLVFSCFRALVENAWSRVPLDAAGDLVTVKPSDPNAPGPYAFADGARLRDILTRAGFHDIHIDRLDCEMHMGKTIDEAVERSLQFGPLGRLAAELTPEGRAQVAARVGAALSKYYREPTGIDVGMAVWIVKARA